MEILDQPLFLESLEFLQLEPHDQCGLYTIEYST